MMNGPNNKNKNKLFIKDIKIVKIIINLKPKLSTKRKILFLMILKKLRNGFKPEKETILD